jgi:Uma2 family endonuclease
VWKGDIMQKLSTTEIAAIDNNKKLNTSDEVMEYMVWLIEIVSSSFFNNNKALTYKILKEYGIWGLYIQNYDVTHTLSASYILQEIQELLTAKGVL